MLKLSTRRSGGVKRRDQRVWRGSYTEDQPFSRFMVFARRKLIWGALLLLATLLFVGLIWLLRFAPQRTPLVVLTAAPYTQPLPPNAWAFEDVENLSWLDGKNLTLRRQTRLIDSEVAFREQLSEGLSRAKTIGPEQPLILWISMHGATGIQKLDGKGEVHLLTPDATSNACSGCIDVQSLLDTVALEAPQRQVLVILDCQKMAVNWDIGLLDNPVSSVLSSMKTNMPENVAVFLAAGDYQRSLVSSDLQGSVFAHYLRQGLAGAADGCFGNQRADDWVSLRELEHYVTSAVTHWSRINRGVSQIPVLIQKNPETDFELVRVLNSTTVEQLFSEDSRTAQALPAIPDQTLDSMWRKLDELRRHALYQNEPHAWAELERDLLSLELMSVSGKGYRQSADKLAFQLKNRLEKIAGRLEASRQSSFVGSSLAVISGEPLDLDPELAVHTIPLANYFGLLSSSRARDRKLASQGDLSSDSVPLLEAALTDAEIADFGFASTHFQRMVTRYQVRSGFKTLPSVGGGKSLAQLQMRLHALAVPETPFGDAKNVAPGTPYDVTGRVHHWTRSWVNAIVPYRRQAEDCLFLDGQPEFPQMLKRLQRGTDLVGQLNLEMRKLLHTCDRSMANAAYYARWATDPAYLLNDLEGQMLIVEETHDLVQQTRELSQKLAGVPDVIQPVPEADDKSTGFDTHLQNRLEMGVPVNTALTAYEAVDDKFNAVVENLQRNLQAALSVDLVGQIEAVLAVPLLTSNHRGILRSGLREISAAAHKQKFDANAFLKSSVMDSSANVGVALKSEQHERLVDAREGLLDAIVGSFAADFGVCRGNVLESAQTRDAVGANAAEDTRQEPKLPTRNAQDVRFAAAFAAGPSRELLLDEFDVSMQALLLWHAEKTLGDFWGAAGTDHVFYQYATGDYLKDVELFSRQQRGAIFSFTGGSQLRNLKERLDSADALSVGWGKTDLQRILQIEPREPVRVQGEFVRTGSDVDKLLQGGVAASFLETSGLRLFAPKLKPIDLAGKTHDYDFMLSGDIAGNSQALVLKTVFRGHELDQPCHVIRASGVSVVAEPEDVAKAKATLGKRTENLSVAFVLDCSHSMGDKIANAAGGEASATSDRLDVAKDALQDLLLQLSQRDSTKVAVHFVGHRLGWSTDSPLRSLVNPEFMGTIAQGLTPSQDVESVFPLAPFNLDALGRVITRVQSVKPWGQSPLYLATVMALSDFTQADLDSVNHVIVITDGANYQYIPTDEERVEATTVADVYASLQQNQVPVHILGLGMTRQHDHEAIEEFTNVCLASGGTFQTLDETKLVSVLSHIINSGQYKMSLPETNQELGPVGLGTPIEFQVNESPPRRVPLTYLGPAQSEAGNHPSLPPIKKDLWFVGGENFQLYLDELEKAIYAFPFNENVAAESVLKHRDGTDTQQLVRVHQPERLKSGEVLLPVSWQKRCLDTTSKSCFLPTYYPAGIWIEIQPLLSSGKIRGEKFVFYDTDFEPGQPVPMVRVLVRDWPKDATKARIRVLSIPSKFSQPPALPNLHLTPQKDGPELVPSNQPMEPGPPLNAPSSGGARSGVSQGHKTGDVDVYARGIKRYSLNNDELQRGLSLGNSVVLTYDFLAEDNLEKTGHQRLRFVLSFPEDSERVDSLQVSLPQGDGKTMASRIVRRYDPSNHLAVHSYYFPKGAQLPTEILLSELEQASSEAWRTDDGAMVVGLPELGQFVPVTSENKGVGASEGGDEGSK